MSSLTVSSKYVEIEQNNIGTAIIKNVKTATATANFTILYKVRVGRFRSRPI
jgi:septum formation topological specificity factor MinE